MGILISLIAFVFCAVIYVRMLRREVPEPIGKKAAALPVALGVFAPFLSTGLVILLSLLLSRLLGVSISGFTSSLLLSSLVSAFIAAGFTEELVKLLLFLLTVKLLKPKNVYEYGLLFAGVGVGFTALEEMLYGGGDPVAALTRLPFFSMHMVLGLIMGLELGQARFCRRSSTGSAGLHTFRALFLPVLWHTVYDASTTFNAAIHAEDTALNTIGAVIGLVVVLISVVLQFVLLIRFRKNAGKYCGMELT